MSALHSGELLAVDVSNGSLVWKHPIEEDARLHDVVAHGDTVYFGSRDDAIYALAAGFPDGYAPVAFNVRT